ncbi:hypothetical protein FEMY_04310 [Ferrovum myxofaciens]|uniref:Uncharacterized protein n=1 Tax=Ferrovum myxofaciens TaxID=416213 RepID=A0A149W0R3_9PROT|nr:hypothetical protein [Ferrovum myxofaciens]KXW59069.1 hypothetical protein FEMY_04310 [Ferrovum myxofaciens]
MKARRTNVQLVSIKFQVEFDGKANSIAGGLAERLGESGVRAILVSHPPILKDLLDGQYDLIAGETQLLIAKAILHGTTMIPALLISSDADAKLFGSIEELIAPLMFRCSSDDYNRRAKHCIDNGSAATLGRNLDTVEHWQQLYKLASGRKKRRLLTPE